MKFRRFEFRLFPKIRNKKKKKPKICNTDFPRDIGLDKNFNYSKPGNHGYYDNLALEDATADDSSLVCRSRLECDSGDGALSTYKTYPLPELKIQVEAPCRCNACMTSFPADDGSVASQPVVCYRTGCSGSAHVTPIGTPNTIPRTRTRIKTNPWLPSPRTTPSPSPTETVDSIIFTSTGERLYGTYHSTIVCSNARGENTQDNRQSRSSGSVTQPLEHTSLHGLVKITKNDVIDVDGDVYKANADVIRICGSRGGSIEKLTLDIVEEVDDVDEQGEKVKRKRFSFTEFLAYDTDVSSCSLSESDSTDFLACVNYKIGFEYEEKADALLDNSGLPRDETFRSFKELLDESFNPADKMEDTEKFTKMTLQEKVKESEEDVLSIKEKYSYLEKDDDKASNESLDKINDSFNEETHSNIDLTFYDEGNMQESIDTGYASVTRETDSMSSVDDLVATEDEKSNVELEWDNEPTTQRLLLDFPLETNSLNGDTKIGKKTGLCKCFRQRSRSLADIELSLDEKVSLLREEKQYVQLKIRQAIEEEQIRRKQLAVFRAIPMDGRKEVLIDTLQDLKRRLENQSVRLQNSYDTVLSLQKKFSHRRRSPAVLETNI